VEFLQLAILLIPMLALICLGLPVFASMGVTCLIYAFLFHIPLMVLAQSCVAGLGSYDLLALPFFLLAGHLMNVGGMTARLLDFSTALIGHVRGGLSHVNIIAAMVFSGVSGSAVADASAIGSVLIPAMKKQGYSPSYAAAVTAASSSIGPIIPPSIPLVIFGLLTGASIGKLFLGGAVPGIMMGVYLLLASFIISRRRGYPANPKASLKQVLRTSKHALAAMVMPVIIIGGISSGIVTPTESGAVAVAYALLFGLLLYKEIKLKELFPIFCRSMLETSIVLIIVAVSGLFVWIIANMGLGAALVRLFMSVSTNKWMILILLNVFLLLWGTVLDPLTAMFVLIPVFLPLVNKAGIDLIHFGVVVVINLGLALVTPPVGGVLFLTTAMAQAEFEIVVKEMMPYLVALILVLITCIFLPDLVLWLPGIFMR
jgi:tripartite ATP-independent transporter DctM subunit